MMIVLKVLKTSDEEKVKGQLLRMVHSLFLQVFFQLLDVLDINKFIFYLVDIQIQWLWGSVNI